MIAFAANSILCRAALRPLDETADLIDPASYTAIRIGCGALVLLAIQFVRRRPTWTGWNQPIRWISPLMLVIYATGFSFAYVGLDTASGTLILFAMVQLSMVVIGIMRGESPGGVEVAGLLLASLGLVYLVLPHVQTPLLAESLLMALAGIAWGSYSYLGKSSRDPISNTAFNFTAGLPLVLLFTSGMAWWGSWNLTSRGVFLAALSGGVASGLGYVLWYVVLPALRAPQAAAVQLSVPILAALGGVLLVGDPLTSRTIIAGLLILGGIGLTIRRRPKVSGPSPDQNSKTGSDSG